MQHITRAIHHLHIEANRDCECLKVQGVCVPCAALNALAEFKETVLPED